MSRGRKAKQGLDYYPMDVDMFSDIKIRKLVRRHGGRAVAVYTLLLCMIYKNGYFLPVDDDLPFILSEYLPDFTEEYIKGVIDSCLQFDLFSSRIYSEEKVISSEGIQKRYKNICNLMKRKGVIGDFNLLEPSEAHLISSEEIPIPSQEIPFSSQEKPISSEETPINTETFRNSSGLSPQKENKKKIKRNQERKKPNSSGEIEIGECRELMKMNQQWKETVIMNRHLSGFRDYDERRLMADIDEFFRMYSERLIRRVSLHQATEHFSNWLNGKLRGAYGTASKSVPQAGIARPGTKIAGEGQVSSPSTITL
jgi:hypothetical protein